MRERGDWRRVIVGGRIVIGVTVATVDLKGDVGGRCEGGGRALCIGGLERGRVGGR